MNILTKIKSVILITKMEDKKILISSLLAFVISLSISFLLPSEAFALSIPNFHKVDKQLYRGGVLKTEQDILNLKKIDIRTVINLEWGGVFRKASNEIKKEQEWCQKADIKFIHIPLFPTKAPKKNDVDKILALIETNDKPIYIHCRHGVDRTGFITAMYRIKYEQWTAARAYSEMINLGFHHYFFYWKKSLLRYTSI